MSQGADAPGAVVPGPVELLLAFANSVDHELGTDDLSTRADLDAWLRDRGLVPAAQAPQAQAPDLDLALRLRDGLHAALVRNHDGGDPEAGDGGRLGEVASELPLRLSTANGVPVVEPVDRGVRGALGQVLVAVLSVVADGSWGRLKICASSECAWAYFDASRNRSRAWCEWGCGNRIKTRNYRARRRASGHGDGAGRRARSGGPSGR